MSSTLDFLRFHSRSGFKLILFVAPPPGVGKKLSNPNNPGSPNRRFQPMTSRTLESPPRQPHPCRVHPPPFPPGQTSDSEVLSPTSLPCDSPELPGLPSPSFHSRSWVCLFRTWCYPPSVSRLPLGPRAPLHPNSPNQASMTSPHGFCLSYSYFRSPVLPSS